MSTQPIPNLIQGVSQQAPQQRRDSQCFSQFDCFNSPVDGAGARPHFDYIALYASAAWSNAFFQEFYRAGEEYVLGVAADTPFALNLDDGTSATMTLTAGTTYIAYGPAENKDAVRMASVEDTTFVLNRSKPPAMAAATSGAQTPCAYVVILVPDTDKTYKVDLDGGTLVATKKPTNPRTDEITAAFVTAINGVSGFVAEADGPVVRIAKASGADFTIDTDDQYSDTLMYACKGTAPSFEKLPPRGWVGDVLKVIGESRTSADDYYVEWSADGVTGVWEETIAPSTVLGFDAATMPHLLVNTGLNAFEYKQAVWSTRVVGDTESSKDPSFIGKSAKDIFYHEQRLGILQESGMCMSKTDYPYTFWTDSVQTVLATAPIDTGVIRSANTKGVSDFDFAVGFDETLFLWSQKAQYRIATDSDNLFKQGAISAKPSTAYEYTASCKPAAIGRSLYVPNEAGDWGHLMALTYQNGRPQGDVDLTAHVPKYIPSGIRQVITSDTMKCMFIRTEGDPSSLYLYNFLVSGDQYIQSAWNKWRVPGGSILWIGLSGMNLRILQQRTEGVVLLNCNLTPKRVDAITGAGYLTRMDLRVDETQVSSLSYASGETTFTLPWTPVTDDIIVIVSEDKTGGYTRGRQFPVTDVTGAVVTVTGDLTGYKFYCGHVITAERTESEFFLRNKDSGAVPTERLTIRHFLVQMAETGYTRIEVAAPNKATQKYAYEGRKLDTGSSTTETVVPDNVSLKSPVDQLSQNATIRLVNDTYLPSYWQSAAVSYSAVLLGGEAKV